MDRRTVTIAVLAALGIVAIGIVAATLTATVTPAGDDSDGGGGDGGISLEDETEPEPDEGEDIPTVLERLLVVLSILLLLGLVAYLILYRREAALLLGMLLGTILVLYLLTQFISIEPLDAGEFALNETGGDGNSGGGDGEGDGSGTGDFPTRTLLLVAGTVALLFLVSLVAIRQTGFGQDEQASKRGEESDDAEKLAQIAGRAANRIEDGTKTDETAENEVYKAWREMVRLLDVDDEKTTTPREFQSEAVDAGMSPADVRELTQLFERIRYGGEEATEQRETKAVTVLRRIEAKYGDGE